MISKKDISKLNGLLYIHALAGKNSKRKVAEELGVSVDTINKYIADFEADMKTHFLVSGGCGTVITPEGERILKVSEAVVKALDCLEDYAETAASYAGIVRLGMPDAIADYLESDRLAGFFREYPDIMIENTVRNRLPDMTSLEIDIGLNYEPPHDGDLVLIRAKKVHCGLYASQNYVNEFGMPKNMDDLLENHRVCDKYNHLLYVDGWETLMGKARHVVYKTNSIFALRQVLERGIGIGICPTAYGEAKLVRVLKDDFGFDLNIYLIAHKNTKDMPRIRAVLDYIKDVLDSKYE